MTEWPSGWFRPEDGAERGDRRGAPDAGNTPGAGDPAGAAGPPGAARAGVPNDPTVRLPYGQGSAAGSGGAYGAGSAAASGSPYGAGSAAASGGAYGPGSAAASGSAYGAGTRAEPSPWPDQPPVRSLPGERGPRRARRGTVGGRRRRSRLRLILAFLAGLVVILLILVIGGYFYLDGKLNRQNVLLSYSGQPAAGAGTNWLITGSDSRQGLTRKQERKYHTGIHVDGQRSDTVMLMHIPANGGPAVLVSLPRDSYVPIPGYGENKLNAAYSFGGPKLLAQTVQNATGLRIEHYMGIGFGGLVNVVNDVGGVTMCFRHSLHDAASGVHVKKGCHTLNGGQALAFVRTRHNFASQDLQREQNQRVFMRALLSKVTSTGTMLNPFASIPAALGAADSLTVDNGTHLKDLISVAFALRNPETTTVPIANSNFPTSAGDAVQWDSAQAKVLFNDLNTDHRVPKRLLSGSHLQG
jgi:LCP family protein required for cell wall assembly